MNSYNSFFIPGKASTVHVLQKKTSTHVLHIAGILSVRSLCLYMTAEQTNQLKSLETIPLLEDITGFKFEEVLHYVCT